MLWEHKTLGNKKSVQIAWWPGEKWVPKTRFLGHIALERKMMMPYFRLQELVQDGLQVRGKTEAEGGGDQAKVSVR